MYFEKEPDTKYVLNFSGGKDSTASAILIHEYGLPLDEVITSECYFSLKDDFSAENPEHMKFIREKAFPLFEAWGYDCRILVADTDYLDVFHHIIEKPVSVPEHKGMHRGFVMAGTCAFKRDAKVRPIEEHLRDLRKQGYRVFQYLGIAADEPNRLRSMHRSPFMISPLELYGFTEADARALCEERDLLSPLYETGNTRQGCWICPYAKDAEIKAIMKDKRMKKAWQQFVELENVPNKIYNSWNVHSKETLHERDARLRAEMKP